MTNPSTPEGERGETAPEVIYLQDGCDDPDCLEGVANGQGYEGITWCADQIHANDTKYIRFDIHEREAADLRKELAEADRQIKLYAMVCNTGGADELHARLKKAESELAEARRDGERLDAIDRQTVILTRYLHCWSAVHKSNDATDARNWQTGRSLRAAIDSALQNEGKQR